MPEPTLLETSQSTAPREVIVSTPDAAAIAQAVRAFVRLRLLRRARDQAEQAARPDNC